MFSHDTEAALIFAAAFVNTVPSALGPDALTSVEALDELLDEHGVSGSRDHDATELAEARALRHDLLALWAMDRDQAVAAVNAVLAEGRALPQLVRHDGWDYHVHATAPDAPLATRLGVEAAMALVDVIRADELDRLRTCAAENCDRVLVDLSRNRSRRYCEYGCGPRLHTAAYRARRSVPT